MDVPPGDGMSYERRTFARRCSHQAALPWPGACVSSRFQPPLLHSLPFPAPSRRLPALRRPRQTACQCQTLRRPRAHSVRTGAPEGCAAVNHVRRRLPCVGRRFSGTKSRACSPCPVPLTLRSGDGHQVRGDASAPRPARARAQSYLVCS